MKNERVTISRGVTLNLGDYQSLRLDVSFSADVADGEDVSTVQAELFELVDSELTTQVEVHIEVTQPPQYRAEAWRMAVGNVIDDLDDVTGDLTKEAIPDEDSPRLPSYLETFPDATDEDEEIWDDDDPDDDQEDNSDFEDDDDDFEPETTDLVNTDSMQPMVAEPAGF